MSSGRIKVVCIIAATAISLVVTPLPGTPFAGTASAQGSREHRLDRLEHRVGTLRVDVAALEAAIVLRRCWRGHSTPPDHLATDR